jgi:DNA-binding transcriptional regulator YiaG
MSERARTPEPETRNSKLETRSRSPEPETRNPKRETRSWTPTDVRGLRRSLRLSQRALAEELGVRQQTVSEWETGVYRPRGASARLLDIVAERAGLSYGVSSSEFRVPDPPDAGARDPNPATHSPELWEG